MIYQSGTTSGKFSGVSYGADVGLILTGGKSKSQSLLAQPVAPPKMRSSLGYALALAGFGALLVAVMLFLLGLTLGLVIRNLLQRGSSVEWC